MPLDSASPEQTHGYGRALGEVLRPGHFVGLVGALGAGKTAFVRGVAAGAQVPLGEVASPTFAIVHPYAGRIPLYHADFYRLSHWDELYATGFFDLPFEHSAVLVEWVNLHPAAAPKDHLTIELSSTGEGMRRLTAAAFGETSEALLKAWREQMAR